MEVIKRNQSRESVKLEKITKRILRQCKDLKSVDVTAVAQKVINGLYDGVTTKLLDDLAIDTAYSMSVKHPDYDKLSLRLAITALHKITEPTFTAAMDLLQANKDTSGNARPILDQKVYQFIKKNASVLDAAIDHKRDFLFDYFGYKTLAKSYLQKVNGQIIERPQYLWMRVACGIHFDDIEAALQSYELLSTLKATHATPTLFNAGMIDNQLSSCFLLSLTGNRDSMVDIYETLKNCAIISKHAGGIGIHFHDVRCKGSTIKSSGVSEGLIPMLKVYNETARYSNQEGKRKGSFACYVPDYHGDIFDFLDIRKNNGKEEMRARDLFTAVWVTDCFMRKVEADDDWYLMDPKISKGLSKVYDEREDGGSFTDLYHKYVSEGKFVRKIKARDLWQAILVAQMETGTPYLLAKDAINRKSNQKNVGVIESSNLCLTGDVSLKIRKSLNINEEEFELPLDEVVNLYHQNSELYVQSFDHKQQKNIFSKIVDAAMTAEEAEVLKITFEGKEIICTPEHKIFTKNRGYVCAKDLNESDELLCYSNV